MKSTQPRGQATAEQAAQDSSASWSENACLFGIDKEIFDLLLGSIFAGSNLASVKRRRRRGSSAALAAAATSVLTAERPMTLRQLFYRLVSAGALPSTDTLHYNRLGRLMSSLRECGEVPRSWLVDHLRARMKPSSWTGLADFGETVRDAYRKDFWASLLDHVEVFCEKDAIAGTIQPVTERFDVSLNVCRGYASISFAGEIADTWARIEKPIHAYYVGDHDPSGHDIERDLVEKLRRYSGRDFGWKRLGIVGADIGAFNLIPLEVKKTDRRARGFLQAHGGACAEIDALPPSELRRRVEHAIRCHIDAERWDRLRAVEEAEQETLRTVLTSLGQPKKEALQ